MKPDLTREYYYKVIHSYGFPAYDDLADIIIKRIKNTSGFKIFVFNYHFTQLINSFVKLLKLQ